MHEQFLLAALDQAWLGRGCCAPNPSVGAVAVHKGQIIAQTWHRGAGTLHAEQLLLEQLPKNISEITLYVTLEPCNHWGKTPPCVEAIVNYGIKQVVYAYCDPNPIVAANNTPGILRKHGIDVLHFPHPAIDDFYRSYRYWTLTHKPWVTVKMAQTMDGKIAGEEGLPIHLSNASCAEFTHKKRLHSDIILTTARTVNVDDPQLNVRLTDVTRPKPIAIIEGKEKINQKAKLFTTAQHCHIFHDEQVIPHSTHANCSYHAMPAMDGQLELAAVIRHLGERGYHDVFVEAGGALFTELHQARLVNTTHVYIVPSVLGEKAVPAYHKNDIFNHSCKLTWQAMNDNVIASFDWLTDEPEQPCSPG